LQPLGDAKAQELTSNMMSTINNIRSGVLGSLGLVVLIYTVITTIQKVEESFNFVWRVEQPRSLARRFGEYLSVMIVGPVLIAAAIGVFTALTRSDAAQSFTSFGAISWLSNKLKHLTPFILVSIAFSFVYGFIPNTKVRIKSAVIGGITAGAIWTAVGVLFTRFVASSTQTAIIYAGFAIVIVTLIWIYTSWLVLLIGAQLSFYVQHPTSLRVGHREVHMTPELQERIGLTVMYLIAHNFKHDTRQWTLSRLSRYLDFPIAVLRPVLNGLLHAKLIVITEEEGYIPARDLGEIQLIQVLEAIRNDTHDTRTPHLRTIAAADEMATLIKSGMQASIQGKTLAEWVASNPLLQIETHRKARDTK
jgi:membrane protein